MTKQERRQLIDAELNSSFTDVRSDQRDVTYVDPGHDTFLACLEHLKNEGYHGEGMAIETVAGMMKRYVLAEKPLPEQIERGAKANIGPERNAEILRAAEKRAELIKSPISLEQCIGEMATFAIDQVEQAVGEERGSSTDDANELTL